MTTDRNLEHEPVYRYTVDNRYGDAMVIVLKASLVRGRDTFKDDPTDWEQEEVVTKPAADILAELAVRNGSPTDADLQPGRVFVRGRFKLIGPELKPRGFEVDRNANAPEQCLRIDHLRFVKDAMKERYSELLVGSNSNA